MRSRWLLSPRARAWIAGQVRQRIAPATTDPGVDLARVRRPYLYRGQKNTLVRELGGAPFVLPYTGREVADARHVDIDHIVSLEEVAECGGSGWTRAQWDAYQSDLMCLMLADPRVNRVDKRAHDCASWVPPANTRWFLGDVAVIKLAYGLTFTEQEADVIRRGMTG